LRSTVPSHTVDRYLSPDIAAAYELVRSGALAHILRCLPNLPVLWQPV
jgi:hypothetical protein